MCGKFGGTARNQQFLGTFTEVLAGYPNVAYSQIGRDCLVVKGVRMARRKKTKRVALAVAPGMPHLELHLRGILQYVASHSRWTVCLSPESAVISPANLRGWSGDGVIAMIDTPADARLVEQLPVPVVNISGALERSPVPRVTVDDRAMGLLAAEHLLECDLRRFGYYGVRELWYSLQRGDSFRERIEAAGHACSTLLVPHTISKSSAWTEVDRPLCDWLESLTPPVGVLACHDYRARMVADACLKLGLNVPDDVAIMGISNDAIACEFYDPPISSVSRSADRVGYEAAALLDRLMAGKKPPSSDVLIPPDGIVRRRSTDAVAIDNAEVAAAVRYMRDHLTESISIDQIARHQGISRRWLQEAFRGVLGWSPHAYLNFLRIRHARHLLVNQPNLTVDAVARACGFSDAKRLRSAFVRSVGVGLRAYRRQHCREENA
ncbi:MAG TPA: hypothetical protein DD670_08470 [Planctomycetaceae bacterium]|nr:hypothetical protein [Planctomycetaceae bacterium]